MRRYAILFLVAVMFFLAAIAGTSFSFGANEKNSKPLQEITAYTSLPAETVSILSEAYEKQNNIRVNFTVLPKQELLQKIQDDAVSDPSVVKTVDIVLADSETLSSAAELNLLIPNATEKNDAVKNNFKDETDRWIGVWYDPIIFCANKDFLKKVPDFPDTWENLSKAEKVRVGITDFLAADASANLMFQMIGNFGDKKTYEILRGLHPKVVQYTKYLSNPVRQAGMGESDISIAVESEALRYIQEGYPLKIVYPADGTSYLLTGAGITTKDAIKNLAAKNFSDWLLSDEAQMTLQKNGFYFLSTNPNALAYKTFAGKNLVLLNRGQNFSEVERQNFLERWVKYIRFGVEGKETTNLEIGN